MHNEIVNKHDDRIPDVPLVVGSRLPPHRVVGRDIPKDLEHLDIEAPGFCFNMGSREQL